MMQTRRSNVVQYSIWACILLGLGVAMSQLILLYTQYSAHQPASSAAPSLRVDAGPSSHVQDQLQLQPPACPPCPSPASWQQPASQAPAPVCPSLPPSPAAPAAQTPPVAVPAAAGPGSQAWLMVIIPTVHRPGVDYLSPTLLHVAGQMPRHASDSGRPILVVVVDNTRGDHPALTRAQQQLAQLYPAAAPYFRWAKNTQPQVETGQDKGSPNVPGARVRQQTRDVAMALELALGAVDAAAVPAIALIMEDDFRLCPLGMLGISQAVRKANAQDPNWIAIRLSYGLNGVLMHTRDIREFSQYLESRVKARPPDHILVEWYCAEQAAAKQYVGARPHFTYRYNLFDHLGKQSSLRDIPQGLFGGCYDVMDQGNVFEVEAFKVSECSHDDIWPCLPASHANAEPPLLLDQLVKQGQVQARHNGLAK